MKNENFADHSTSLIFYSIDATHSKNLCHFVNDIDWKTKANCRMKIIEIDQQPHLCLFATQDIPAGEELRYDYGYKKAPWRKKVSI